MTSLRVDHPTRVAIDGRSAAGKTTFADELAVEVQARGREVLRASIDDWHRPGHKYRSMRQEWTPQSYYDEGFNIDAFEEQLLRPLGPGGSRRCRLALFDAFQDEWLPETWIQVGPTTIVFIDGVFLLRPEFAGLWDYSIWIDIDVETMIERARRRDVAWVGSDQDVVERYRRHWVPTHEFYERLASPVQHAHAVIDNRDIEAPVIRKLSTPTR